MKPLNPGNGPDPFEREALQQFEQGKKEVFTKEKSEGRLFFRYMAPLMTETSCLKCHAKQGYVAGDIRGGISVTFDIADIEKELRINKYIIIALAALTIFILLGVVYFFILKLVKKLSESRERIQQMAITDDLTGCYNRRYFFLKFEDEFERARRFGKFLSCVMMDIDHFKKINDTYGHQAGDVVLKKISTLLKNNSRSIDTTARYGGEEFIIILPETEKTGAATVAEKWRELIEGTSVKINETQSIRVTCSFGVAAYTPAELKELNDSADIIKAADISLYLAKAKGRNRVEVLKKDSLP